MSHKDALFNIFNYTKYLVIYYLGLSQNQIIRMKHYQRSH